MQRKVVTNAIPIEYIKVFTASGWVTNLMKFCIENSPLLSVKAKMTMSSNGNATNIAKNRAYGMAQLLRRYDLNNFIGYTLLVMCKSDAEIDIPTRSPLSQMSLVST